MLEQATQITPRDPRKSRLKNLASLANLAGLAGLASYAPAVSELLNRVGLERRRSRASRTAACVGLIGVGAALGGGLALLLAPRSGSETRERLGVQAKRARDYIAPESHDSGARASPSMTSSAARAS